MIIKGKDHNNKSVSKGKENLKDKSNKRNDTARPTNSEGTAAWQSPGSHYREDNVNKPSIERVIDAKDWVDNGSRL